MHDQIEAIRARVAALSPQERAGFRAKVEARGIDWSLIVADTPPRPRPDHLPLSPAQMQFWLLQQVHPETTALSIAFAWDVEGALDLDALRRALTYLIARHEPLRTAFTIKDGTPTQQVRATVPFDLATSLPPIATAESDFVAQAFDLGVAPLFRVRLLQHSQDRFSVLFAFHHIICDGWSRGIFLRELAASYQAYVAGQEPDLPPITRHFADIVLDQTEWLASSDATAQAAFWRAELEGIAPQSLSSWKRAADTSAETVTLPLGADLSARIAGLAAQLGVSQYVLMLAVFQLLLHRLTGAEDIAVGTPTAGRDSEEKSGLIGLFVNTLVLRNRIEPDMTFRTFLARVGKGFARAFEHQDLPFARVVDTVGAARNAGQTPLFQTLFQVQTGGYAHQNAAQIDLGDPRLAVRQRVLPLPQAKFDLSWHVMDQPGGYGVIIEYRPALFSGDQIRGMKAQFETLLHAVADAPDMCLSAFSFIPPDQTRDAVLRGPDSNIPDLLQQIEKQKGAEALICATSGQSLDYADLWDRAGQMANGLLARPELHGPDARVAISMRRGPDLVVAMLAALRAGLAYVPLDPEMPVARRDYILQDADVALVLSDHPLDTICPLVDPATLTGQGDLPAPDPDRIAYLIYTSGSTGWPKGVPITRRALSNLIASTADILGTGQDLRMLALTTVAFDISALEIFLPLSVGGTLVMAGTADTAMPAQLAGLIPRHGITHMQATPATWRLLLDHGWHGAPELVALSGGEALPTGLAQRLHANVKSLWNMYGPTETTIWSAALKITPRNLAGPVVPVGGPVANTSLRVLDPHGAVLPAGIAGELAIGGAGLSPGYRNRPDMNMRSFLTSGNERLYRTGDRVVLQGDTTLQFLGRVDHQIKLNGYRIEPGEIEAALTALPEIAEALAMVDGGRLLAYYRGDQTLDAQALRRQLADSLPSYMIPAQYVRIAAFPLNPNGKIDRAQLPKPDADEQAPRRTPTTGAEVLLHGIWADVLQKNGFGVDDNFFDLGGDSVRAIQIASRARESGLILTPAQMFENQTVALQAAAAQSAKTPWQVALSGGPIGNDIAGLAPVAGDSIGGGGAPVQQMLGAADLAKLHADAKLRNTTPARLMTAALARTIWHWRQAPFSLVLIDGTETEVRAMPAVLAALPSGVAGSEKALTDALAVGDRAGIDPRRIVEKAVIASWQAPAEQLAQVLAPTGLHLRAEAMEDGILLKWEYDPGLFSGATIARLAARHVAELRGQASGSTAGNNKLNKLRAQLKDTSK
ncbi:amino acid adenylation domain-containing protein [Pseudorhodobacter turbinis]|uniref:Amino acid adenylation domain-containing protein n=1 Tax=Pseudorhodobacter turbinis TaxID=2500533 RepID=A0A4P8EF75_9RHOB|nr:non-ribosomal peptide synthetase [Pseudorhodobacter turbinis]QCO55751.1 amino acid adenylation domain-containing protein [Pseudorhodobacter turbinis]